MKGCLLTALAAFAGYLLGAVLIGLVLGSFFLPDYWRLAREGRPASA